jgi:carbon-monoxide dehydrogenase small subunit
VAAVAALAEGVRLERAEVVEALSGNLCRCTGYQGLVEAVRVTSLGRSRS